jgi:hypothetical protein
VAFGTAAHLKRHIKAVHEKRRARAPTAPASPSGARRKSNLTKHIDVVHLKIKRKRRTKKKCNTRICDVCIKNACA